MFYNYCKSYFLLISGFCLAYCYEFQPVPSEDPIPPGPRVLVLIAKNNEDLEVVTVISILRKAKIYTEISGINLHLGTIPLQFDLKIVPDVDIELVKERWPYDMMVFAGGPGYRKVLRNTKWAKLIIKHDRKRRYIAAMSTAQVMLQYHEISFGKKITCLPIWRHQLSHHYVIENKTVVHDGHLITSQSPAAALDFSLYLVEVLKGKKKADKVAEIVSYKRKNNFEPIWDFT